MAYYHSTVLRGGFDESIRRVEAALKAEGFGVITRIDFQNALKTKLGIDFRPYTILGACNPALAYEAIKIEDKVGTMLPCNVIVQKLGDNEVEIASIDPVESMQAIDNPALLDAAREVRTRLIRVVERLGSEQPAL